MAIETSGHGALKENHWLDDGAYLMVNTKALLTYENSKDCTGLDPLSQSLGSFLCCWFDKYTSLLKNKCCQIKRHGILTSKIGLESHYPHISKTYNNTRVPSYVYIYNEKIVC